ncbi:DUF2079 domain-containing protein [Georgenia thermotolerans]|uniref:DUF2079 domain-containing protein n=1 Tax=Georgenia thermotolerans TaxID=527326 RepID=A0A7J5UQJ5_9MICO|nr:DUF2079 domain-containing protein [Georgenia thermotolerans]KAE8764480.1 DUF2079 domain-containing protein [Georgenia thermotolerans]
MARLEATQAPPGPGAVRTPADRWVPWALAGVVAALYATFAVLQWRLLESPSWDLGIFTQLAQAYAHGRAPIVTIKGEGFNLLGDHFHPLLVVLGPAYRLFPSGLTLLVLQALLLGLSVAPVAAVAREHLGRRRGTVLGVAYGLSWGLQGAVAAQFHEIALAVPLLAWSLAAFVRRRWWACAAWAAPLVFVKEDLGLTVAVLGLVIAWRGGADPAPPGAPAGAVGPRRLGLGLATWGLAWVVLAIGVILPALNPQGRWDYTGRLGSGESGGLLDLLLGAFVPAEKYLTLLLLVGVAGVVGLRSPLAWLAVPTLAWRFLGNVEYYWGWQWHYSAILMPVAALALVDAVTARSRALGTETVRAAGPPPSPGRAGEARRPGRLAWPTTATLAVAVSLATTLVMLPSLPLTRLADPATWRLPARHDAAMGALAAVAPGATVETDIYLMAYLVPRAQVYWVGNPGNPAPDFVELDSWRRTWPDRDITDAAAFAEERHPGTDYRLVYDAEGYQVAQRVR